MVSTLVTGGTGFIGQALVRRLVERADNVRVFDNNSRGVADRLRDVLHKIELVEGDIRDPASVRDACKGMERVIHLAYINGTEFFYSKPELVLEVGVKGMMNVLDGCLAAGVKELFTASSSEVYHLPPKIPTDETAPLVIPDPHNPRYSYAGGKIISELLTINYGRKHFKRAIVFRPHNVYGPDMGWEHVIPQFAIRMKELVEKQKQGTVTFPLQGSGIETRAFIFIDDFVDGLMHVIDKGEHLGIYHIGTREERSINDVANEIALIFGRSIVINGGPPAPGGTPRRCPDISRVERLGFKPKTSFETGLRLTVDWYRKHTYKSTS